MGGGKVEGGGGNDSYPKSSKLRVNNISCAFFCLSFSSGLLLGLPSWRASWFSLRCVVLDGWNHHSRLLHWDVSCCVFQQLASAFDSISHWFSSFHQRFLTIPRPANFFITLYTVETGKLRPLETALHHLKWDLGIKICKTPSFIGLFKSCEHWQFIITEVFVFQTNNGF